MEEGWRTQRTMATAHNHHPKNHPLHGQPVACPRRGQPTIPPNAEPQHRSCSASRPRSLCGQPRRGRAAGRQMGGRQLQRSCQPLPGDGGSAAAHRGRQKCMGFPSPAGMSPSSSWPPLLPLPGLMGRGAPARVMPLRQCHAKYRTAGGPAGTQTGAWWWDATRHVQLPFDAPGLGSLEMRPGLQEEKRSRCQVKAACQSWRDILTNVQVRWRRDDHLGRHGVGQNVVDRWGARRGPMD